MSYHLVCTLCIYEIDNSKKISFGTHLKKYYDNEKKNICYILKETNRKFYYLYIKIILIYTLICA